MYDYDKHRTSLRYWMLGRNFHAAHRAMEFGLARHTGLRKDGKTPEFMHQISIAQYVRTLESTLLHAEDTLSAVFLHDVLEDKPVEYGVIESAFGSRVAHSVDLLSKFYFSKHDMEKSHDHYYGVMSDDPIASIVKGADRVHNFQSMIGVFTHEKQVRYIDEARTFIIPMLKRARKAFTEPAYQNIKHMMLSQIALVESIHDAAAGAKEQATTLQNFLTA